MVLGMGTQLMISLRREREGEKKREREGEKKRERERNGVRG